MRGSTGQERSSWTTTTTPTRTTWVRNSIWKIFAISTWTYRPRRTARPSPCPPLMRTWQVTPIPRWRARRMRPVTSFWGSSISSGPRQLGNTKTRCEVWARRKWKQLSIGSIKTWTSKPMLSTRWFDWKTKTEHLFPPFVYSFNLCYIKLKEKNWRSPRKRKRDKKSKSIFLSF